MNSLLRFSGAGRGVKASRLGQRLLACFLSLFEFAAAVMV